MRFGHWLKRESQKANQHIAAGSIMTIFVVIFGPNILEGLGSSILVGVYDGARWFMLLVFVVGIIRAGYGVWRRRELHSDPYGRYQEELG